ncbi:MAG: hypothetical protein KGI66_01900 [Patescibacteria group bacterium]|nr:hypothetical protein [Patescibacteria group bacterium]
MTRTKTLRAIRFGSFSLVAALIVAYAVWRSFNYARGPEIIIDSPVDGSAITATTTIVSGQVLRATSLTLNGDSISVDQNGDFHETIIVFPGVNDLSMTATDRFGRTSNRQLEILGAAR